MAGKDQAISDAMNAWDSADSKEGAEFDNLFRLWKGLKDQPPVYTDAPAIAVDLYPSYTCVVAASLWLEDHSKVLFDSICIGFDACAKLALLSRDEIAAVVRLTDLLLAILKHVPAANLATLFLKSGIRAFCGCVDGLPNYNAKFFSALAQKHREKAHGPQPSTLYRSYQWLATHYVKTGEIKLALGRLKEAEAYARVAEKGLARRPMTPAELAAELNEIGSIYTNCDHVIEAERLLKEALTLDRSNAALCESMGWLKFKMRQYPEALSFLERALSDEARCQKEWGLKALQESRYHLVCVLMALGEEDRADQVISRMYGAGNIKDELD